MRAFPALLGSSSQASSTALLHSADAACTAAGRSVFWISAELEGIQPRTRFSFHKKHNVNMEVYGKPLFVGN